MDPKKIEFKLERIKTLQFVMYGKEGPTADMIAATGVSNSFDFKINHEHRSVSVYCNIKFHYAGKPIILIETCCEFHVNEESWNSFLRHGENKMVLPQAFLLHIATIAVGTTRGIVHAKTEGTPYNMLIVPAINLVNVISKDLSF